MRRRLNAAAGTLGALPGVVLVGARASALVCAFVGAAATLLAGCGGVYYAASVNGASARLEQARQLGAETLAPYEYYYAKAHLEQAEVEASEASYGDAAHYAETAEEYAQKAVELSQSSTSGAVRKGAGGE